jgi:4-hydroxybenzoate polyprenyltransferase
MPQAVLGVAFSFGIPMAFAAVQGRVPLLAWLLLLGNLFWVLAYDTEYAMVDRDDDIRIGMRTSAITLGRWDVPAVLSFYLVQLAIWSWVIVPQPREEIWWLGVLVVLAQVVWHATLIKDRSREGCFKAFRANHWVGFTLFAAIVLGYI